MPDPIGDLLVYEELRTLRSQVAALREAHTANHDAWNDTAAGYVAQIAALKKDAEEHVASNAEWRRLTYEAQQQVAALRADAERYRFLRNFKRPDDYYADVDRWTVAKERGGMGQCFLGEKLDAAIDVALAADHAPLAAPEPQPAQGSGPRDFHNYGHAPLAAQPPEEDALYREGWNAAVEACAAICEESRREFGGDGGYTEGYNEAVADNANQIRALKRAEGEK